MKRIRKASTKKWPYLPLAGMCIRSQSLPLSAPHLRGLQLPEHFMRLTAFRTLFLQLPLPSRFSLLMRKQISKQTEYLKSQLSHYLLHVSFLITFSHNQRQM